MGPYTYIHKHTSQILDQIGPVGRFGEKLSAIIVDFVGQILNMTSWSICFSLPVEKLHLPYKHTENTNAKYLKCINYKIKRIHKEQNTEPNKFDFFVSDQPFALLQFCIASLKSIWNELYVRFWLTL